jgi:integrase
MKQTQLLEPNSATREICDRTFLTRAEADHLLAAHKARHLRLFVEIGLHTGARHGAILALTWDRVDLIERVIDFRSSGERKPTSARWRSR